MEAAGLWKALLSSTYLTTGCCSSKDRNRSIEKLQSMEQGELLEISETKERSFRYNVGYHTLTNLSFTQLFLSITRHTQITFSKTGQEPIVIIVFYK